MSPFVIIASLVLLGITAYLVANPLLKPRTNLQGETEQSLKTDSKEEVFATLAEIEFDYQMGKLTKEDYNNLKNEFQPKAISILKENEKEAERGIKDRLAIEMELEAELERELAELKKRQKK